MLFSRKVYFILFKVYDIIFKTVINKLLNNKYKRYGNMILPKMDFSRYGNMILPNLVIIYWICFKPQSTLRNNLTHYSLLFIKYS